MATSEDLLHAVDEVISDGVRRGLLHNDIEDEVLDGRLITVAGEPLVNFGSCSYLGLETDPRMKAAVREAVDRYGTQFSSSRAYASSPLYRELEHDLADLFGRPVIVTPSTTMGHLAAMPALMGSRDSLILDHQVHHSVQTAAKLAQAAGASVELLPHNDLRTLERRLQAARGTDQRVWYAADGLYSMYADFFPAERLSELAARYDNLWLYVDDAHSASWTGRHGRGYALEHLSAAALERTVVALSLNKSFAAAGGVITFPDEESHRFVSNVGGPLIFSGPVQPPMLGAIRASARLHRLPEIAERQELVKSRIRFFNQLAAEARLPLVSDSEAPIRYVGAGVAAVAYRLTERLRTSGYFVNTATFPAVPAKRSGARMTITAHHTEEDIAGLVEALAEHLPAALADEGATVESLRRAFARQLRGRPEVLPEAALPVSAPTALPALRLEHRRSIAELDTAEWDALFAGKGAFDSTALRMLERVFDAEGAGAAGQTEDAWDFHYWTVRDTTGRPVAATFFTTALWKDDMLSPVPVSAEVERRRTEAGDPYLLSSPMLAMGSLLSEGDHLYLDRSREWRGALRLLMEGVRVVEDAAGAAALVLRDLPDGDDELHDFLLGEGFLRMPMPDSWVREIDFADDAGFLAQLPSRRRKHQRKLVLPWEDRYAVSVLSGGSAEAAALSTAERDVLYRMYLEVHGRGLDLNVFPLPRRVLDAVLAAPGWELLLLSLPGETEAPVAFAVQHVAGGALTPLFAGLDYDFVASHHSYQQLLWQVLRRAKALGVERVFYGMSADLHKVRFGARRQQRWAYVQPTETYNSDVLAHLAETVRAA